MHELNPGEVAQVSGGNWLIREVGKGVVVDLIVDGIRAGGRGVWDYVKKAPPEVFQRERRVL